MVVALLIVSNFIINVVAFELLPQPGSELDDTFNLLEVIWNYIFLSELIFNLVAHWFWEFFTNSWNVFDLLVVSVSTAGNVSNRGGVKK